MKISAHNKIKGRREKMHKRKDKKIKNTEKKDTAFDSALNSLKNETISTDPLGMWTGVPEIPTEKPVQDADDL